MAAGAPPSSYTSARVPAFKVQGARRKTSWTLERTQKQTPERESLGQAEGLGVSFGGIGGGRGGGGGGKMQSQHTQINGLHDSRRYEEHPLPRYESYDGSQYSSTTSAYGAGGGRLSSQNAPPGTRMSNMSLSSHAPPGTQLGNMNVNDSNHYSGFDFGMSRPHSAQQQRQHLQQSGISINTNTRARAQNQDAVGQHLLYETALLDSQAFEILEIGEVDALKKEHVRLNSKIEATQRKLALESKVRDAAQNLQRLYSTNKRPDTPQSPDSPGKSRSRLLGGHGGNHRREGSNSRPTSRSGMETMQQADSELAMSAKKVDELHGAMKELWDRRQHVERRLLRHTAAVLAEEANKVAESAVPGLVNGRHGTGYDDDDDDEDGEYTPNEFDGIRDILHGRTPAASTKAPQYEEQLASVQSRLEGLNAQLRGVISEAGQTLDQEPPAEEMPLDQSEDTAARLENRFTRLEGSVHALELQQQELRTHHSRLREDGDQSRGAVEAQLQTLNRQLDDERGDRSVVEEQLRSLNVQLEGEQQTRSANEEQLHALNSQVDGEKQTRTAAEAQLQALSGQLDSHQQTRSAAEEQLQALNSRLDDEQQTRSAAEEQLQALNTQLDDEQQTRSAAEEQLQALNTQLESEQLTRKAAEEQSRSLYSRLDSEQLNRTAAEEQFQALNSQLDQTHRDVEAQLHGLSTQLHHSLREVSTSQPAPPQDPTGNGYQDHAQYLEENLMTLEQLLQQQSQHMEQLLQQQTKNTSLTSGAQQKLSEYETTLGGLWEILQSDVPAASPRLGVSSSDEDDGAPPMPASPLRESFSLPAFSTRVQNLFDRAQNAKEQQEILKRQIQQQRDLNGKSDAEKDGEITGLRDRHANLSEEHGVLRQEHDALSQELANVMVRHQAAEEEVGQTRTEMMNTMNELEEIRKTVDAKQSERDEVSGRMKAQIEQLELRLAQGTEAQHSEMESLEGEVVRLTTELTMARAELDGAYGSRAERKGAQAAEVQTLLSRNGAMAEHVGQLERELQEMTQEFQELTKESIELEKEREQLDGLIDSLRDRCESLEGQLGEEKLRWAGVPSSPARSVGGGGREQTSMMVLRQEFKKMMRDQRVEGIRLLRTEQEERRRLETELRKLRQANGPLGKNSGSGRVLESASGTVTPVSSTT